MVPQTKSLGRGKWHKKTTSVRVSLGNTDTVSTQALTTSPEILEESAGNMFEDLNNLPA